MLSTEDGRVELEWTDAAGPNGFSPDSRGVLIGRADRDERGLMVATWTLRPDAGGPPTATFRLPDRATGARWAPDGTAMTYRNLADPAWNVYRQPLDGGPRVAVTRLTKGRITDFRWSPDGSKLAARSRRAPPRTCGCWKPMAAGREGSPRLPRTGCSVSTGCPTAAPSCSPPASPRPTRCSSASSAEPYVVQGGDVAMSGDRLGRGTPGMSAGRRSTRQASAPARGAPAWRPWSWAPRRCSPRRIWPRSRRLLQPGRRPGGRRFRSRSGGSWGFRGVESEVSRRGPGCARGCRRARRTDPLGSAFEPPRAAWGPGSVCGAKGAGGTLRDGPAL